MRFGVAQPIHLLKEYPCQLQSVPGDYRKIGNGMLFQKHWPYTKIINHHLYNVSLIIVCLFEIPGMSVPDVEFSFKTKGLAEVTNPLPGLNDFCQAWDTYFFLPHRQVQILTPPLQGIQPITIGFRSW